MLPAGLPRKSLETEIESAGLGHCRDLLVQIARPKISILGRRRQVSDIAFEQKKRERSLADAEALAELRAEEMRKLRLGASRLGGVPDLPADWRWPVNAKSQKLPFACQLDCSLLPRVPGIELPEGGWLYLFAQNNDRDFPLPNKVLYFPGSVSALKRAGTPSVEEMAPSRNRRSSLFDLVVVEGAELDFALPVAGEEESEEVLDSVGKSADRYHEIATRRDEHCVATMLGFGGMGDETPSQMANERGGMEGEDWLLLFQMHQSIPTTNIHWLGDHDLRVYIRLSALKAHVFDHTYATVS